jgi:hypothetical protein
MSYDFVPLDVNESAGVARGTGDVNAHAEPYIFFSEILKRPNNEKQYLHAPAGDPADGAKAQNITKKRIDPPWRQVVTRDLPAITLPLATAK